MCKLAINITHFVHLLKRVDFDAIVDHLVLTHIIKSKAELTMSRIKRFVEISYLVLYSILLLINQLTNVAVIALHKAIAEAMSNNGTSL